MNIRKIAAALLLAGLTGFAFAEAPTYPVPGDFAQINDPVPTYPVPGDFAQ